MLSFGYNSFWNFMHGSPAVQELLGKPDLKIDELLEEDGLLLELKTSNQKLVNFLLREENLKELISYVISEPDAEEAKTNQKKAYKYPFVCADVLSSDSPAIVAEFFKTKQDLNEMSAIHKAEEAEDQDEVNTDDDMIDKTESTEATTKTTEEDKTTEETTIDETEKSTTPSHELPYLDFLFTFLDAKEMNLTSAGYFAKIVNNLFTKKPSALLTYLYEIKPVLLEKMINHISSKSIAEFVAKILTFESSILANSEEEVYNTKRSEILKLALKKLSPSSDIEEINNTAFLICEVLGKYNTMHCSQEVIQNLLEKQTIDYFFEILRTQDSTSCCAIALILGNIFAYYILINGPKPTNQDDSSEVAEPPRFELTEDIPLVKAFIDNLENIVQYVCNTSGNTFTSQYGAQVTPFGSARLKIVELIIIALKANNETIYNKLFEYQFIEGLLNLFVKYEWNNLLHNQVEKILSIFLDSNYDNLKTILFERIKLLDFVIDVCRDSEYTLPGKHERKIVKGYNGQITNFANKLALNKDPVVKKYTDEHDNWKDFVETTLNDINKKNDTRLGGKDPRQKEEEESNDIQMELPGIIQKFTKYFNSGNKDNDLDDDDEDDEQNEDDLNKAQDEDEDNDEDEEEDTRKGYESIFPESDSKHIIKINSKNVEVNSRGRASFGYPKHEDEDEDDDEEDNHRTNIESMNEPQIINENLKVEEQVLDNEYTPNAVWKKVDWHTADDVLKELDLL